MKKLFFLTFFVFFISAECFCDIVLSKNEQNVIDDFWAYRVEATIKETDEEAADFILEYKSKKRDSLLNISDEARVLLDALIYMEYYNYKYGFAGECKEETRDRFAQYRSSIKKMLSSDNYKKADSNYIMAYADLTSYYMAYSIPDILTLGYSVKRWQERALQNNESFSPALLNYGQWFYYAPRIFGGGKDKTRLYHNKAINSARTPAEEFFARQFYSQFLFEMGELDDCKKQLDAMEKICPESRLLRIIREQNAKGLSLNDYNKSRSRILKSADEYRKKNNIKE